MTFGYWSLLLNLLADVDPTTSSRSIPRVLSSNSHLVLPSISEQRCLPWENKKTIAVTINLGRMQSTATKIACFSARYSSYFQIPLGLQAVIYISCSAWEAGIPPGRQCFAYISETEVDFLHIVTFFRQSHTNAHTRTRTHSHTPHVNLPFWWVL